MSLFQEAIKLNNRGVHALLGGDHRLALAAMGESIKMLKRALAEKRNELNANEYSKASELGAPGRVFRDDSSGTRTVSIPSAELSETIVFNQLILIPEEKDRITTLQEEVSDIDVYTCVVIFNVALIQHFKGDTVSIAKAEQLYVMANTLSQRGNVSSRAHTALVVKLACTSNLSQIRHANGDEQGARSDLSQVTSFIHESALSSSPYQAVLGEPAIQRLIRKVLLLQAPTMAPAA